MEFVALDCETTGISPIWDRIIEIGAFRVADGKIVGHYHTYVNPDRPILKKISMLTGIDKYQLTDKPKIDAVIPLLKDFVGDRAIVIHNAPGLMPFFYEASEKYGVGFDNMVIDTLALSEICLPRLENYYLNTVADALEIAYDPDGNALSYAGTVAKVFMALEKRLVR